MWLIWILGQAKRLCLSSCWSSKSWAWLYQLNTLFHVTQWAHVIQIVTETWKPYINIEYRFVNCGSSGIVDKIAFHVKHSQRINQHYTINWYWDVSVNIKYISNNVNPLHIMHKSSKIAFKIRKTIMIVSRETLSNRRSIL